MKSPKLFIKNMVCPRCIYTVESILSKADIGYSTVALGEAELLKPATKAQLAQLDKELKAMGFELIDNRKSVLIENIKKAVLSYINEQAAERRINLSAWVAEKLNYEYTHLSHLYSSIEGITIEQYYILQKVEKAKELLVYDQLSMAQIADLLGYSSVHHLSAQFKKVTGLTPSHFRRIGSAKRQSIDSI